MRVLIVDDEPTSRLLLGRIISREFNVTVIEAADGREALGLLELHDFDFVLLDLLMPGMDGLDTLAAIRASDAHRALPVVVLSSVKDEVAVRRILQLGVSDYLAKPLHPRHIIDRLSRFLATLRASAGQPATPNAHGAGAATTVAAAASDANGTSNPAARADQADKTSAAPPPAPAAAAWAPTVEIVVADSDPQFRAFVRGLLGSAYRIIEAETGARALRRCQESRPAMLLLGEELGAVDRPLLARKIRALPELRGILLVAAAAAVRRDALRLDGLYDGTVTRTLSTQVFQDDFAIVARAIAPPQGAGELVAGVRLHLVQTVEHVFGMMLGVDMRLQTDSPPVPGIWIRATIELTLVHEDFTLAVVCACPAETGLRLSDRVRSVSSDWVGGDPAAAALGEVAAIITERVQQTLVDQGRRVHSALAEVRREPARGHSGALLTLAFDAVDGGLPFRVSVGGSPKEAPALAVHGAGR